MGVIVTAREFDKQPYKRVLSVTVRRRVVEKIASKNIIKIEED
jgi:hypothetical protein